MNSSWIFLSHSSKDIKLIRRIRNEFENCGHNPLAFHLKCLDSSTPEGYEEILQLLKREIDARNWFVFCESENSKKSEFVKYERDYIISTGKDKVWTIDLSASWDDIKKRIRKISKDLKIYVSFSECDSQHGELLVNILKENDYTIMTDEDASNMENDIYSECAIYGLTLMLVSSKSLDRVYEEIDWITNYCNGGENIIPIFIGNPQMDAADENWLRSGQSFDVSLDIKKIDFTPVIEYLDRYIKLSIDN